MRRRRFCVFLVFVERKNECKRMIMKTGKISLVRVLSLLVFLLGFQSVWADVWDGVTKTPAKKQTIDGKDYYLIESAANLAWFADSSNRQALNVKWQTLINAIEADSSKEEYKTRAFKDSAISLMEAIRKDPESYYSDPDKKALWNKAPYKGYLQKAWSADNIKITMNARITAEYLDMNNKPFIPIAAGNGPARYVGTFEGNGVPIKNLRVDSKEFPVQFYDVINGYASYCQNLGLFGVIGDGGKVRNLVLDNVTIMATGKNEFWANPNQVSVGPVVGWMTGGSIDTCYTSGIIISNGRDVGAGGIIGAMTNGKEIRNALSTVSVDASGIDVYVGGISGVVRGGATIANSVYDGDKLVAHPDEIGAQGALIGRIVNNTSRDKDGNATGEVVENLNICYYDKDVLDSAIGTIDVKVIIKGDYEGVSVINTPERACNLNGFEWKNGACSDSTGIWSNDSNIVNNGVTKNNNFETEYLIKFDANGGSYAKGAKTSKILKFNAVLTDDEISTPTNGNKAFAGWALTSTATKAADNLGCVYGPRSVYAVWENVATYTVTFDFNTGDGATQLKKTVGDGELISTDGISQESLPSTYKVGKKVYYFAGWSASKTGSVLSDLGVASKDVTFYAQWTLAPTFKVSYDMNGHGTPIPEEVVSEGDEATVPDSPSADGYVFGGWFTEADCKNQYNFKTALTENVVLYAKWTPVVYDIVYNLNGGKNAAGNPVSYTVESPNIVLKQPIKTGYEFKGWFYDGGYTNPASQITTGSTGNVTLYANWQVKVYTINYAAGAMGYGNILPATKKHGEAIPLLGESYLAPGFVQDGWATVDGGEKVFELGAVYTANASVDLLPHWAVANYTITYHNVENAVNDNPVTYQRDTTKAITLTNPTRIGFKFDGWYKEADFSGSKVTKIDAKTFGDLDFYAKWNAIGVVVTVTGKSFPYDGKMHGPTVSVAGLPSGYTWSAVMDSVKNVAEGDVPASCVSFIIKNSSGEDVTDKFSVTYSISGSVSVTPKTVSFTGKDADATYTGDEITVESKANSSGLLSGHTHNVGYTITATEADVYPATNLMTKPEDVRILDADGNDVTSNYTIGSITPPSKGLTIKPSGSTFSVYLADQAFLYDGTTSYSMTGTPISTALSGTTTFQYQFQGDGDVWTDDLSSLKKSAEGTYKINVKATNPNYSKAVTTSAKLIVSTKTIVTITTKSKSKVYDGSPLTEDDYTVSGVKSGDVISVTLKSITDAGIVENGIVSCGISRDGSDVTAEYDFNKVIGKLEVEKAPLVVVTSNASKVFDGTPLTAGMTVNGLVNNETATVVTTGSQKMVGSSENTYELIWDGTAKSSNYKLTSSLGILTVKKGSVTITVADATKLYGDVDPEFAGAVSGLADLSEIGSVTYYRTNRSDKDAGVYAGVIKASYKSNLNYDVTVVPAKLTIKKRNVTLTSATASKVYDGEELTAPNVAVGGDGFATDEGAIFTVTGSRTDAGVSPNNFTYVIKAGTDTAKNYMIAAPVYGTLTVDKSPVVVTVKGNSGVYAYSETEQVVSGYELSIDNLRYSTDEITFSGDSVIRKTNSGSYVMGLAASKFANGNANFDVTFNVTDGSLVILPPEIVVTYNDNGDTLHVVVNENDSDSLVSEKINDALKNHVPPIPLPTKSEDGDSTYAFAGWEKNPGSGTYEAKFDGNVKTDSIKVKYQENPDKFMSVEIHVTDSHKDIVQKINDALEDAGIPLPAKESDGDSTYTLGWEKNEDSGIYEPVFKGTLITIEIAVAYGDGAEDTIHVEIRPKDTESQINSKINEALAEHLPPITVEGKDSTYTLMGWKEDEKTGYYVPVFSKGELVFKINFHLPEGAELTAEFEGYVYGQVTKLPTAVMKLDTTWVFKGWYTKPKGRGDRIRSMRETDYGNKSLYPLFQKTIRYDANGVKGEIEVIYTDRAEVTITRALDDVIPANYTKGKSTFAFDKWVLKDGVYTATFKKVGTSFNVYASARGFTIEEAKLGARLMVLDLNGKVVKRGVISNESQRVEVPKSGSYTVRVGKQAAQVNVK